MQQHDSPARRRGVAGGHDPVVVVEGGVHMGRLGTPVPSSQLHNHHDVDARMSLSAASRIPVLPPSKDPVEVGVVPGNDANCTTSPAHPSHPSHSPRPHPAMAFPPPPPHPYFVPPFVMPQGMYLPPHHLMMQPPPVPIAAAASSMGAGGHPMPTSAEEVMRAHEGHMSIGREVGPPKASSGLGPRLPTIVSPRSRGKRTPPPSATGGTQIADDKNNQHGSFAAAAAAASSGGPAPPLPLPHPSHLHPIPTSGSPMVSPALPHLLHPQQPATSTCQDTTTAMAMALLHHRWAQQNNAFLRDKFAHPEEILRFSADQNAFVLTLDGLPAADGQLSFTTAPEGDGAVTEGSLTAALNKALMLAEEHLRQGEDDKGVSRRPAEEGETRRNGSEADETQQHSRRRSSPLRRPPRLLMHRHHRPWRCPQTRPVLPRLNEGASQDAAEEVPVSLVTESAPAAASATDAEAAPAPLIAEQHVPQSQPSPSAVRTYNKKRIDISEHHLTGEYFFNSRTMSLRATLAGEECIVKVRTPNSLLQVMGADMSDKLGRRYANVVSFRGVEDEAQLLHRLEGQLEAPKLLSRGFVSAAAPFKVRLKLPDLTSYTSMAEGEETFEFRLTGPFYAVELLKFGGCDAPNMTQLTLLRAAINLANKQQLDPAAALGAFQRSYGKPIPTALFDAVAATAPEALHRCLLRALEVMHGFSKPKKAHEMPEAASEDDGFPPTKPYSPLLGQLPMQTNDEETIPATHLPAVWTRDGGEFVREMRRNQAVDAANPGLFMAIPPTFVPLSCTLKEAAREDIAPDSPYTDVYGTAMTVAMCALAGHPSWCESFKGWSHPWHAAEPTTLHSRITAVREQQKAEARGTDAAAMSRVRTQGLQELERVHQHLIRDIEATAAQESTRGGRLDLDIALACLRFIPPLGERPGDISLQPLIEEVNHLIASAYGH
ncbi:unnamed protein product [Vitrella brassicaformis CCMP3155]|uniref:Uncharacterized protein n=1 Tax=Vitrella brassicaformis (strain CCMP3155) TaxID=1169540 RepID=A0A0G4EM30_VITBC|nr:unnamed protein product [Vitrella brassicaformis CCMP3155]|eukprot:CEL97903.1 unnamed protein product [Vitrella brassicaformis CCMP3155]